MNNLLEKLVTLQKLDLEIRKLGHALQQIPKKMIEIDKKIESTKLPFEEAKKKIEILIVSLHWGIEGAFEPIKD